MIKDNDSAGIVQAQRGEPFRRSAVLWDPMPRAHVIVFYLGIPLLMSVIFGINHTGLARFLPPLIGIPYWAGIWIPFLLLLDVCTRSSAFALRPWSPPLWLILFLGSAVALFVVSPYVAWYVELVRPPAAKGLWQPPPSPYAMLADIERLIGFAGTPLFWIAINYYYDRILGIPRYLGQLVELAGDARDVHPDAQESGPGVAPHPPARQEEAGTEQSMPGSPMSIAAAGPLSTTPIGFRAHLPAKVGNDIIAIQAEDHYVRVHTALGSALIRYRFSDALRDVADLDGLQVHRSFWVARNSVSRVRNHEGGLHLVMCTGLEVPVSRAYREALRVARIRV